MKKKDIIIRGIIPLRGPNMWTYRPVLEAWVELGELEEYPSNKIPGFPERLAAWLPSLVEHRCNYGEHGGFLRRVREGTWAGHILEHVTLELQYLAGLPGGFGPTLVDVRPKKHRSLTFLRRKVQGARASAVQNLPVGFGLRSTCRRLHDLGSQQLYPWLVAQPWVHDVAVMRRDDQPVVGT